MTTKIPLKPDDVVSPGDRIELNFNLFGPDWLWSKAVQGAMIEARLARKYPNFKIHNWTWSDNDSKLAIVVDVIEPEQNQGGEKQEAGIGATISIVAISAAVLGTMLVYYFTQDTTYKIVQTATPAISLLAIAAILYLVMRLFGKGGFAQ